jgi:hypothetical protein
MELRRIGRIARILLLLSVALLVPSAAGAMSASSPPPDAPLDAYGDDTFLLSSSLAPNVVLLMDNSESMNQIEWHYAFDQEALPVCDEFTNDDDYTFDDLKTYFGIGGNPADITVTVANVNCDRTRTLWDPSSTDAKSVETIYRGRYLNWYFSAEADPWVAEIETATTTGPGCKGIEHPDVYRRTRFQASKQVMLDVLCIAEAKNVRFALANYRSAEDAPGTDPNGGYLVSDLGRSNPNHAIELESGIKNALSNDLSPDGADETPVAEALFQIYTYWMSRNLADLPTSDQDGDTVASTFPPYPYSKFGNFLANSGQWLEDAMLYPCEKAFVVIVTDGLPTRDDFDEEVTLNEALGFSSFDDLIGDYHADGPGEDAEERPGGFGLLDERAFFLDDIAKYMYENDFRPDMAGTQTIDTYTVGFSTDTATNEFLSRTALLGNGLSFTAKDGEELAQQLVAALNDIIEKTASFTAASVPSARTSDGADFYQSYFFPRGGSAFWEGHVRAWHITAEGEIQDANGNCALDDPTLGECNSGPFHPDAVYFWDAAEEIPQPDEFIGLDRKLYVSKSDVQTSPLSWPTSWIQANIEAADLQLVPFTLPGFPEPNNEFYDDRGSTAITHEGLADEIVAAARGCYFGTGVTDPLKVSIPAACDPRPSMLGDIFHSNPVVVRSPSRLIFGPDAVSYNAFKTHYATTFPRDRVLYAGTNAGFLEAIHTGDWDAGATPPSYDEGTGTELFGFMPWEARLKIKNLPVDPAHPRTHYVDGDPQSADVWFYNPVDPGNNTKNANGSEWHTILVGAMREGGHHYYALDITNPSNSTHAGGGAAIKYPGYLWEFPTEADFDAGGGYYEWMGETWGKPIITKVRLLLDGTDVVDRWVVIVTAGYHPFADPNPTDVTGIAPQSPPLPPTVYSTGDPATDPDARKGRAIFMLDAMTGEVIAMKGYNLTSADPTTIAQQEMKYAIVGRPSVLDLNADGYADIVYFVDMGGQVFKWVISDLGEDCVNRVCDARQPNWPFKLFFKAPVATISGTDFYKNLFFSPAAAYAGGQLWLAFGTGERRSLSFAGIGGDPDSEPDENNRYYVVTGDEDGATVPGRGLFFRADNGEKFVTNTEIFAGHVIAGSFTPTTSVDPCTARGDGTLYVFDILTGEGYFDDGAGNEVRGLDIGAGLPTDPQVSVGAGGEDNKVIIEKSGTEIEMIEEQNINVGGGLLYWRERF